MPSSAVRSEWVYFYCNRRIKLGHDPKGQPHRLNDYAPGRIVGLSEMWWASTAGGQLQRLSGVDILAKQHQDIDFPEL